MKHFDEINRLYLDVLGRFADDSGLHTYGRLLTLKQIDLPELRNILKNSDEYKSNNNKNRDDEFIDLVKQIPMKSCTFSKNTHKCVVFIEGRKLDYVKHILCNAYKYLDNDWGLLFITTKSSLEYYINELNFIENVRFKIVDSLDNVQEYNDLCLSLYFWKVLLKNITHAFVMQSDSLVIRPIDSDWLKYDYIGAASPCATIMNGGLSIRNVQSMIDCLYDQFTEKNIEEDKYFTGMLQMLQGKLLPDYDTQRLFSWESVCGSEIPSGIHKLWVYKPEEFQKIKLYVLSQIN